MPSLGMPPLTFRPWPSNTTQESTRKCKSNTTRDWIQAFRILKIWSHWSGASMTTGDSTQCTVGPVLALLRIISELSGEAIPTLMDSKRRISLISMAIISRLLGSWSSPRSTIFSHRVMISMISLIQLWSQGQTLRLLPIIWCLSKKIASPLSTRSIQPFKSQ